MTARADASETEIPRDALFFDGRRARGKAVSIRFGAHHLTFDGQQWDYGALRARAGGPEGVLNVAPVPSGLQDDGEARHEGDAYLSITNPAHIARLRALCPNLHKRSPWDTQRVLRQMFGVSVFALAAMAGMYFLVIPVLAEKLAETIPSGQEVRLGNEVRENTIALLRTFDADTAICRKTEAQILIDRLVERLLSVEPLHVPIDVVVVRSEYVNAIAMPGGRIAVTSALLDVLESGDAFAGVLAHELGHVKHRDNTREVLRAAGLTAIVSFMTADFLVGGATLVVAGDIVLDFRHSRNVERRADGEAIRRMRALGAPLAPMGGLFRHLRESEETEMAGEGENGTAGADETSHESHSPREESSALSSLLASHPTSWAREQRFINADEGRTIRPDALISAEEWAGVQSICDDAREGNEGDDIPPSGSKE